MASCIKCKDTGVLNGGSKKFPCTCIAGDKAQFHVSGVDGPIPGNLVKRHFLNNSPDPIYIDPNIQINADVLKNYYSVSKVRKTNGEIILSPKCSLRRGQDADGNLSLDLVINGRIVRINNKLFENSIKFIYHNQPNPGG